jgi:peroxiredoxin Q/BCP
MLKVGDLAPPFEVKAHTGRTVRLSDYAGQTVVLWFYPKADTPGCTMEGNGFCELNDAYEAKGVRILGVSFDTVEENAAFAEKFAFPYPLLCDTTRAIGLAYHACDKPQDVHARRITYVIGPDGRIKVAVGDVKAAEHPASLLASLE